MFINTYKHEYAYPLPNFVMLEVNKNFYDFSITITLVDKKHGCVLDSDVVNVVDNDDFRLAVYKFKRSLYTEGVI